MTRLAAGASPDLATHPVEPEPQGPDPSADPLLPYPWRQPVQPEFEPEVEPVRPEDPPPRHKAPP